MNPQLQLILQQAIQAFQSGNFVSADLSLRRVLQIDSKNLPALHILGLIKASQSNYREAADYLARAARIHPNDASIQYNLAKALSDSGNDKDALAHHKKAVALAPNNPEAWLSYGKTASNLGRYEDALVWYGNALSLKPDYAEASLNKGATFKELERYEEAIAFAEQALSINPNLAEAWTNKGVALKALKCFDEAITHYDKALSLKPDYHEAWTNKGVTLHELKRYDEAITHYDKALSLKPDYHEASWNKSLCLLLQGDFENGLQLYESRWTSEKVSEIAGKRSFDGPAWLGAESLQDKTILLYGEQGLGDFIQFCRYVKLVAGLGAKVILEVPQSLATLLTGLTGVSEFVIKGQELPPFDFCCPIVSLPLAFNTRVSSIPAENRYIASDVKKASEWRFKLGEKKKKRVGLVWSSLSNFQHDAKRSLLLSDFVKALPVDGYEYVCLQKELKDCDKEFFKEYQNIQFFGDQLNDFSDTAALIESVDLVVSTCTSVPHLSAAMGKETWVLLSHVPDWRWLLDREDSPWYPSMKLYRQNSICNWNSVLDRVKSDLSSN